MKCSKVHLPAAIFELLGYIEQHRNPFYQRLKNLSKKVRRDIKLLNKHYFSVCEKSCKIKEDADINHTLSNETEVLESKHRNRICTIESGTGDTIWHDKRLRDEIKQLDKKNNISKERQTTETAYLTSYGRKEFPFFSTERKRLYSYINDLAEKVNQCKKDLIETTNKLNQKQVIQENYSQELIKRKENEIRQLSDENLFLQRTINQIKEKLNLTQALFEEKRENELLLEHKIYGPSKVCKTLEEELKEKEGNSSKEEKEKNEQIIDLRKEMQRYLRSFEEREAKYGKTIASLTTKLQEKDSHSTQLDNQLENAKSEHDILVQEMLCCKRKLTEAKEKVNKTNNELCLLRKRNENLEKDIARKESNLQEHEQQSEEQVILLKRKIKELQKNPDQTMNYHKGQLENMERKIITVNKQHKQTVEEKDKEISALKQAIKESDEKIYNIEMTVNSNIKHKEKHIFKLSEKVTELKQLLNQKDTEIRKLENSIQTVKENSKETNYYRKEIAEKEETMVKINERLSQMEIYVKSLENEIKEKDSNILHLNREVFKTKHHFKTQKNIEGIIDENEKMIIHHRKMEQQDAQINNLEQKLKVQKVYTDSKMANEIRELRKELEQTLSKQYNTEAELDETKTRLSKTMGDRLTDNNPNITDLSDKNRPTKLAEKCAELYDNQWTDAFEVFEKYYPTEETAIESLLHILEATMNFCRERSKNQLEELGRILHFADKHDNFDVPTRVIKQLKDVRKSMALSALVNLRKMFAVYVSQSSDQTVNKSLEIKDFTFECLEICWLMMVNDPPVTFAPLVATGESFNTDLYKTYTTSGTHVRYVVWPALLLHDGGPVLAKGVAQGFNISKKKA